MPNSPELRALVSRYRTQGRIEAIVLRRAREQAADCVDAVEAVPGRGLIGDRRAERQRSGDDARRREITLFQFEHLAPLAAWSGTDRVDPAWLRRNLVIAGTNLIAMRSPFPDVRVEWQIGAEVRIEVTGPCDPCSRMEEALGPGGYNAMRGHGGMTARIVAGGRIGLGDRITCSWCREGDSTPTGD